MNGCWNPTGSVGSVSSLSSFSDSLSFLRRHACLTLQVKTETTADLNVLHEQKSKHAAEEHEKNMEGNEHVNKLVPVLG